jgi:hypothetical protein
MIDKLISGKHIVEDFDGVRCTLVEAGLEKSRLEFLKDLLIHNGFEVKVLEAAAKSENEAATYKLGVTNIIFNPMIAIYQKRLRRKDGKVVTPAYWRQQSNVNADLPYYLIKNK